MPNPTMLDTTIPFSGFYESIHSHNMDRALEQVAQDDQGDAVELFDEDGEVFELFFHFDNRKAMLAYAQLYAENFAAWVQGETKIDLQLQFDEMQSPREYNFQTDRIFAKIPLSVARELYRYANKEKLNNLIREKFTSRDGFISSYDNSLADWRTATGDVSKWDHNQIGTLLECVITQDAGDGDKWELWIMEDADSNGDLSDIVWDALDADAVRIVNAHDNARRASEWFKEHQLCFPFWDNHIGYISERG